MQGTDAGRLRQIPLEDLVRVSVGPPGESRLWAATRGAAYLLAAASLFVVVPTVVGAITAALGRDLIGATVVATIAFITVSSLAVNIWNARKQAI